MKAMRVVKSVRNWQAVEMHGKRIDLHPVAGYSSKYGGVLRDTEKDISDGRFPKYAVDLYNEANIELGYVEDDPMYCLKCGIISEEINEEDLCPYCEKKERRSTK